MRAWLVEVDGFDLMAAAADTRGKAATLTVYAAREAGYSTIGYPRVRVVRCARLDSWASSREKPLLTAMSQANHEAS